MYIFGGAWLYMNDLNSYVEEFDTRTFTITTISDYLPSYVDGGLSASSCVIPMPDENAFVLTGGTKSHAMSVIKSFINL